VKKLLVTLAVILAVVVPVAASATTHPNATVKPHIIGTWPDDVNLSGAGGYVVWSNGKVQALSKAPSYGSLKLKKPVNDIVGFAADSLSGGYWLIGANGAVYGLGSTCQDQSLVAQKDRPRSDVVGAINTTGDEGFEMVTSSGHTYSFTCQFVF
jgi:hypothetical protein